MILDLDIHVIMEKIIKSYGLCLKIDVKRTNDTGNVKKNLMSKIQNLLLKVLMIEDNLYILNWVF